MGGTNEEYIMQIINSLKRIDYIKPDEIPNIDLYMDQVTTFMDKHLKASKRYEDDKMLTKTMINNYTKNNLLPSPNKKKYSKEHMLLLIFIYYFKNILSINDIQSIFTPLTTNFFDKKSKISLEEIYNEVFHLEKEQVESLTKDVIRKYTRSTETFSDVKSKEEREFLTTFSLICMLSFDVYIKKMIIEKLIDRSLAPEGDTAKKPVKTDETKTDRKTETK